MTRSGSGSKRSKKSQTRPWEIWAARGVEAFAVATSLLWAIEISAGETQDRIPAALRILSSSHLKARVSEYPGWYHDAQAFPQAFQDRQPAYVSSRRTREGNAAPASVARSGIHGVAQKGATFPNPTALASRSALRDEGSPAFMGYLGSSNVVSALRGYRDTQVRVGFAARPQATGYRQFRLGYQEP